MQLKPCCDRSWQSRSHPCATSDAQTCIASGHPTGHPSTTLSDTPRTASPTDGIVALRASDGKATGFVPAATGLLTAIGRDGCFKQLAPTFSAAFGYTENDLLERPFIGFIHPADRPATSLALAKLVQGEPTICLQTLSL
jgi:PAS domain-containing protein